MRADKTYEHDLNVVLDLHDQSVFFAFDIEHNPISRKNISGAITGFDVVRRSPFGMFDFRRPCLELLFAVCVSRPEFDEFCFGNQAHFLFYPILGNLQGFTFLFWEFPCSQPNFPGDAHLLNLPQQHGHRTALIRRHQNS
jgi:hypothetical protein